MEIIFYGWKGGWGHFKVNFIFLFGLKFITYYCLYALPEK